MIFTQIWERYFLKEFFKTFFLFLFCFYSLYIVIDYVSHTNSTHSPPTHVKWYEIFYYYCYNFISRAEILIPFALLISLIRTLCSLNTSSELVAFLAAGFKLRTIVRPFILTSLFFTFLLYLNEQYLLPTALKKLRVYEDPSKHQSSRNKVVHGAKHVILEDGSLLLFHSYDTIKKRFFDTYWIASNEQLYRIKYLDPHSQPPIGYFVDAFSRQSQGPIEWVANFKDHEFPEMHFNPKVLQSTLLEPEALSLKELWSQKVFSTSEINEKESKVLSAFYWKMVIPWLCLLAILSPIPFCVRHSRSFPIFFIYACGVFGFIAFYLLMDALQIVAKRQVLDPFWSIIFPFLTVLSFFSWRFFRLG